MKKQLDFSSDQLAKLMHLFDKQRWEIDTNSKTSVFNGYVHMLSQLTKEHQNFIMKISERFLHIGIDKYSDKLLGPLRQLRSDFHDDFLLIAPRLPEDEQGKIKSGSIVVYQLLGNSIKAKINLGQHSICRSKLVDFMCQVHKDDLRVVLVDDFVGTGETAWNAVQYVKKIQPSLDNKDIVIVCIVAMQAGIEFLAQKGVRTYYANVEKRGITDYYQGNSLAYATKVMSDIEALMNVKNKFRFGYNRSEALVCMERCPNNTFPFYWLSKNAPYAR